MLDRAQGTQVAVVEVARTSWQMQNHVGRAYKQRVTYRGRVAAAREAVLQAPGCQLPDYGQAGARVAAPQLVPLCCRRHEPHQQGQRWVQQRILAMRPESHVMGARSDLTLQEHMSGNKPSTAQDHLHTPQELPRY